jgi:GTP cyclohydrolase I
MLPFFGNASIAYLPKDKVIGASKLTRILLAYAHRLQLQERIARQVANSIMTHLQPHGVAVIIEAKHLCIACRGVKNECSFVTSVMLGSFRENQITRMEVLSLLGVGNEKS